MIVPCIASVQALSTRKRMQLSEFNLSFMYMGYQSYALDSVRNLSLHLSIAPQSQVIRHEVSDA